MSQNILARAARSLSFAHLGGLSAKKVEDDEEDKKAKAAEDEEKEDDKTERDHEDGSARKGKAEDDEPEAADDEDEEDKKKESKKAKRARAEKDEESEEDEEDKDDDKEEMSGKSATASARRRERARCAAIFGTTAAARNVQLAATLAFDTTLTRQEAIRVLEKSPAVPAHAGRAARNPNIGPGGNTDVSSQQAVASSWDRTINKVCHKK